MENSLNGLLIGSDIHGFRTMDDLDVPTMMEEAKSRWLRPNEIHAILCNYKYFTVHVKPINLPRSGTIVLFDRKKLRNFRKDGHNWKKKKDGKTVKEAHEHLKVGNEERIHVYYAHGEVNLTFVRRCYWLLDKSLEHIVLVHYRETQESQCSPAATPVYSSPSSGISDLNASWPLSEEADSVVDPTYIIPQRAQLLTNDSSNSKSHEMKLRELNTLEWDELVVPADPTKISTAEGVLLNPSFTQQSQYEVNGYRFNGDFPSTTNLLEQSIEGSLPGKVAGKKSSAFDILDDLCFQTTRGQIISEAQQNESRLVGADIGDGFRNLEQDALQSQDNFGQWINSIITDSPASVDNPILESPITIDNKRDNLNENQLSTPGQFFSITDISHAWAPSSEETKIFVFGAFNQIQQQMPKSNIYCVCGRACVPAEEVQPGVFRCLISPQAPGLVNLFLSFDGHNPISQPVTFEFRAPLVHNWTVPSEDKFNLEEFKVQMRLAHMLFSPSKILNVLSSKLSSNSLKEAKKFARKTSHVIDKWPLLTKSIEDSEISSPQAKDNLFELMLQRRLWDWLLERVIEGNMKSERDERGQGVIHLCAILGYTWAVYPFEWAGRSLDYRDKFGWTALHWAAYYGREKMIATLQSAGAKSYLVTDPTSENPGGLTAADLASKSGYEGLAAFLAEKALVEHLGDMKLAGNAVASLQTTTNDTVVPGNFTEEELHLKDTLAAYRTAADAAARIQEAFREHSFKVQTKSVESTNPEAEARNIIAAMKIQHAFRNFETRKQMAAAVRIQYRFRTWKMRKDFLNMRRQTIKIQSIFRGIQVRRQYRKITWSVGVLEKAILRWRLKRKGFRGLQVNITEEANDQKQESGGEEGFFQASRKQAEERVERSVVKVQAMFRSKRAQEEYRRMKQEHNKASAEHEGLLETDMDMS